RVSESADRTPPSARATFRSSGRSRTTSFRAACTTPKAASPTTTSPSESGPYNRSMREPSQEVDLVRSDGPTSRLEHDRVAVEEPLEVRIGKTSVVVTMRTPGHDEELAAGFLITEGVVQSPDQIESIAHCDEIDRPESRGNIVIATLSERAAVDLDHLKR